MNAATFSFYGQTVAVLGGGSGIGRAVADAAAAAGARVYVLGRSAQSEADREGIQADMTDSRALARAFADIGRIDHLVLTAGARVGAPALAELSEEALRQTFDVKLFGSLLAVREALPYLTERASVTFTSGLLARKFSSGGLLKSTVNAALEAAAKNLAKELAPRRVNVVSPGVVDTELWGEAGSAARQATLARIGQGLPVGRVGQPRELAQAYLLAMANGFISGAVLDVEGGALL
ncbi:SDR family oxidoreductase [Chromobacterium sp. S0633]|uniref:SDR family oxidoreductase n=1 Tax=Chromobacterium sp. S0633 TaxID=2957805 RepID=UPI00209D5F2F|nr:SDR family oxidoreductase [Chromobacterium sp. S0633]MCP1291600.1 SDR family oxidoreductase [Chromobacterium sp. S0633]